MATLYCKQCEGAGTAAGLDEAFTTCNFCSGRGMVEEVIVRPDLTPQNIIKLQERHTTVTEVKVAEVGIPKDRQARKERPVARGVLDYFPDALAEVAHVSFVGNEQHNPGQPMHWSKHLSSDEADALVRHLLERGKVDTDGLRHSAKVAWRALAMLQREMDAEKAK